MSRAQDLIRTSASSLARRLGHRSRSTDFTLDDVHLLNAHLVEAIRDWGPTQFAELSTCVTHSDLSTGEAAKALREYGIVIMPDAMSAEMADRLAVAIETHATKYASANTPTGDFEDDSVLVLLDDRRRMSYDELAGHSKPVVQVRPGQDAGMIDIFNADRLLGDISRDARSRFENDEIAHLIRASGYNVVPQNFNCYVNRGITTTRGFHVDSYSPQLKAFVYLTDVHTLDDGPYTFVVGSHKTSEYRRANRLLASELPNRTETPFVPWDEVLPVLGGRGTLVISDQSGFHRGFPQASGSRRVVAVMNYRSAP